LFFSLCKETNKNNHRAIQSHGKVLSDRCRFLKKKIKLNGNNLGKAIKNTKPTNSNSMSTTLIKEPNLQGNRQIKGEEAKVVEVEEAEVKPTKGLSEIYSHFCGVRQGHTTKQCIWYEKVKEFKEQQQQDASKTKLVIHTRRPQSTPSWQHYTPMDNGLPSLHHP